MNINIHVRRYISSYRAAQENNPITCTEIVDRKDGISEIPPSIGYIVVVGEPKAFRSILTDPVTQKPLDVYEYFSLVT